MDKATVELLLFRSESDSVDFKEEPYKLGTDEEKSEFLKDILAFANGKLAGYKKLHMVEFIDAIPKVASGKILRRELKDLEKARRLTQ